MENNKHLSDSTTKNDVQRDPLLNKSGKPEIPSDKLYAPDALFPRQVLDSGGEVVEIEYEEEKQMPERGSWGGKIEFLFTCIAFAVGLGNVWRFPYLCYKNGGGAFLIPYVLMLVFVGLPIFFFEFAFGQFASLGPISIWSISPLFRGVGYAMVIASWILALYYNVVVSHCIFYLFASMTSVLPWSDCKNEWNNNVTCRDGSHANMSTERWTNFTFTNASSMMMSVPVPDLLPNMTTTPTEEYYENYVLGLSSGIDELGVPSWRLVLCLLLAWIIVLGVLLKGVQSLGKVAYFTAIFPYIMLTILLFRGIFLPGSLNGIRFYVTPDFARLADPLVWTEAATQIFFSLSCCNGGLIAMSSYNNFKNNCCRDAVIVAILNCLTSVYAGFVIFANLGFMAHVKGTGVGSVAKGGPGLAFVVYPEALTNMPISPMWSVFFFIMMMTLGFGSQFSIAETVLSGFQDELRRAHIIKSEKHRIIFRTAVCVVSFALGIPMLCPGGMYLLTLIDYTVSGFPFLILALSELLIVCYLYGIKQFEKDIYLMINEKLNIYWKVTWCIVTPLILVFLLLFYLFAGDDPKYGDNYYYPEWAIKLSYLIGCFPIVFIPIIFLYRYCRHGGWTLLKEYRKPLRDWGPAEDEHRKDFIDMIKSGGSINKKSMVDGAGGGTMLGDELGGDDTGFFQSKMSVASKLSRQASKEALNKMRTVNSSSNLRASAVDPAALAASQQLYQANQVKSGGDVVASSSPNIALTMKTLV